MPLSWTSPERLTAPRLAAARSPPLAAEVDLDRIAELLGEIE